MPESAPLPVCPSCKDVLHHSVPVRPPLGAWEPWVLVCPTHGRFLRTVNGLRQIGPIPKHAAASNAAEPQVFAPAPLNRSSRREGIVETYARFTDESLKHLNAFAVRVDATGVSMPPELAGEIEQRLRQAGIAVGGDGTTHPLSVSMVVKSAVCHPNQSFLRTQVRVLGALYMTGGSGPGEGAIWGTEVRYQLVSNADIETCLRHDVEASLDEFVTRYRAVNQQS